MDETEPPGLGFMWLSVEKKIGEGVGPCPSYTLPPTRLFVPPHLSPTLIRIHPSCPLLFAHLFMLIPACSRLFTPARLCQILLLLVPLLLLPLGLCICASLFICLFMPIVVTLVLLIVATLMGHPMVSVSNT